jgi:hypothetical protein
MPLTSRRSSGLEQVIFLQCSEIAIALAGPIPERAEAISSTEAELTLIGLADTEKLKIDKTLNRKTKIRFLITMPLSKIMKSLN